MTPFVLRAFIVAAWYTSNIGVILLNKYLLSFYGFKFPVLLTMCHMLACSIMGLVSVTAGVYELKKVGSRAQFLKIAVLAVVFGMTIVLGNISLRYIPVSFNQAIGATTPAFTAALSFVMQRKIEGTWTYVSLVPVISGVVVSSGFEPSFNWTGFLTCVTATSGRAFKSVLQAMLLADESERMDSMSLLTYMAPIAALALLPAALVLEPTAFGTAVNMAITRQGFLALLLINSFTAFFVNLLNFLVTRYTSALTLQVLGNAKGVVAAVVSVLLFRNPVTVYGSTGFAITVAGVVWYSQSKKQHAASMSLQKHKSDAAGLTDATRQ